MKITIIGAGVSGLTTAVVLREAGHDVTIFAKETVDTTSAAAAAIWYPYHIASEHAERWADETRRELVALLAEPEAGVSMIDFDVNGERVHVPLVDTTFYLPYLRRRFGGPIVQRDLSRDDLAALECDVLVNCAGYGARELFGDEELVPGYGIAVVADRPALDHALVTDEPLMYVIPRTADCILGGYDQAVPPPEGEVEAIVARCRAAVPEVTGRVRAVKRGIRPVRTSVRLERTSLAGKPLVHNYGHGGAGFTVSWGCAREVLRLTGPPS